MGVIPKDPPKKISVCPKGRCQVELADGVVIVCNLSNGFSGQSKVMALTRAVTKDRAIGSNALERDGQAENPKTAVGRHLSVGAFELLT